MSHSKAWSCLVELFGAWNAAVETTTVTVGVCISL